MVPVVAARNEADMIVVPKVIFCFSTFLFAVIFLYNYLTKSFANSEIFRQTNILGNFNKARSPLIYGSFSLKQLKFNNCTFENLFLPDTNLK